MALDIYWSPKSLKRFHDVINYLEKTVEKGRLEILLTELNCYLKPWLSNPKFSGQFLKLTTYEKL